ncbi:hypothetical protein INR49_004543 [Caranx melampygus]|nr:hypothetical protein INR49_004543 [Caranx melampygus]
MIRVDTWSLGLDDGLRRDADPAVVQRQLAAGQAVGPAVVVALHHRLAAVLGPFAHRLAGFDGLVLEVDGADGRVHGAQEEEQIRAAAGTWTRDRENPQEHTQCDLDLRDEEDEEDEEEDDEDMRPVTAACSSGVMMSNMNQE